MEFSVKNIFAIIFSLFIAFTLYWFIQFGSVLWFLGWAGNKISEDNSKQRHEIHIKKERLREKKSLIELKRQQDNKKRVFIASGDKSKQISVKEKLCNEAIFKAMADKSEAAKANKKLVCKGV